MSAVNPSYSHSSSAMFIAMHKGALYSLRKGDNQKVGAHILIYGHWPPSQLTQILVFFLNYYCTSITYETQERS